MSEKHVQAVILTTGELRDIDFYKTLFSALQPDTILIAADGGANNFRILNILPNMIIGDMDSITKENYSYFEKLNVPFRIFPANKDKTDTELAIEYAIEKECNEIILINEFGERLDHLIANVFLVAKYGNNIQISLLNSHNKVYFSSSYLRIANSNSKRLSLIPITGKVHIEYAKGVQYPLANSELIFGNSLGISNKIISSECEIKITSGKLLIMVSD